MNRNIIIISGMSSAGNRLIKNILLDNGFVENDKIDLSMKNTLQCMVRSLPHSGKVTDYKSLVELFREEGFNISFIVPVREFGACVKSHSKKHNITLSESENQIVSSFSEFLTQLPELEVNFRILPYESVILYPKQAVQNICYYLGISVNISNIREVFDGNKKWYGR